ncbi:hypothetical protein Tco_0889772, partial [Tanacetum coccineum]
MRKRIRELRLQGVATRLNYSSEDVDEERKLEAPPGFRRQPLRGAKGKVMEGIPPLLVARLRETERRRRTLSPREASITHKSPCMESITLANNLMRWEGASAVTLKKQILQGIT